jgi:hypothetical protein
MCVQLSLVEINYPARICVRQTAIAYQKGGRGFLSPFNKGVGLAAFLYMDNTIQHVDVVTDATSAPIATSREAEEVDLKEHHIHMPNPSLWPVILSAAILVAVIGLLFIPDNPWLTIIAIPFILIGIMGWALEDPMASQERFVVYQEKSGIQSRFKLGQDVVDAAGHWVGLVQARFPRYILVDRGGLSFAAYYIPQRLTEENIVNDVVRLTVTVDELQARGANIIPDDLYDETPEPGLPRVTGVPLFGSAPLSPAQTGHYNYGPNYPGINTDASGSYQRGDVTVRPQTFVSERRKKVYKPQPQVANQN